MVEKIRAEIEKIVNSDEVFIYNVVYVRESNNNFLRVTIDSHTRNIDLDLCVEVNKLINTYLDEVDPIDEEYILEVSSRGAEEVITTTEELDEAMEKFVFVEMLEPIDKIENFNGRLLSYNENLIIIECNIKGILKKFEIEFDMIKSIRNSVDF